MSHLGYGLWKVSRYKFLKISFLDKFSGDKLWGVQPNTDQDLLLVLLA